MFGVGGWRRRRRQRRQSDFDCSGAEHSNASQFNKEAVKIFIFALRKWRCEIVCGENYFALRTGSERKINMPHFSTLFTQGQNMYMSNKTYDEYALIDTFQK